MTGRISWSGGVSRSLSGRRHSFSQGDQNDKWLHRRDGDNSVQFDSCGNTCGVRSSRVEERQASYLGASHMAGGWAGTQGAEWGLGWHSGGCLGIRFQILLSFTLEVWMPFCFVISFLTSLSMGKVNAFTLVS